jgi:hypothetical protein
MKNVFIVIWILFAFSSLALLIWHEFQVHEAKQKAGVTTTQPANGLYKRSHYLNHTNQTK